MRGHLVGGPLPCLPIRGPSGVGEHSLLSLLTHALVSFFTPLLLFCHASRFPHLYPHLQNTLPLMSVL